MFLSIDILDILRSGTNLEVALQPISPKEEIRYFHHLKPLSREQTLTGNRTTVERCDGDTNMAVVKAERLNRFPKQPKLKLLHCINCILFKDCWCRVQ